MNAELEAVLTDYLLALEQGTAPTRDCLLAKYPTWHEELASFLDAQAHLNSILDLAQVASAAPFPQAFGKYTLLEQLGIGGMGVVYRARIPERSTDVALKMIRSHKYVTPSELLRFRTEIAAASRLAHPAVAVVYETGEVEGHPYYTMPILSGGDLAHARNRWISTPYDAARIVRDLARGIEYSHKVGVLHRDLKPGNVLFDEDGRPYLTDFGLAKLLYGGVDLTRTGQFVGTPGYLAPECLTTSQVTTSADIYGLGGLLYFALTGHAPFEGPSPTVVLQKVTDREPDPPSRWNPAVRRDLDAITLQCLAKEPNKRYSSASELADDLDRFLTHQSVAARRPNIVERTIRTIRRYPTMSAMMFCLLVLAGYAARTAQKRYEETQHLNTELAGSLDREREQLDRMRQFDYAGQVKYAGDLLQDDQVEDAAEVLSSLIPNSNQPDLREYAWHHLWRLARCKVRVQVNWSTVQKVAFSPDDQFIACLEDRRVTIVDSVFGRIVRTWNLARNDVDLHDPFIRFGWNQAGTHLFLTASFRHQTAGDHATIVMLNCQNGERSAEVQLPWSVIGGVFPNVDGSMLIVGGGLDGIGRIVRWQPTTGQIVEERRDTAGAYLSATRVNEANPIYLTRSRVINREWMDESQFLMIPSNDLSSAKVFDTSPNHSCFNGDCSPDGKHVAFSTGDGTILIWNRSDHTRVAEFKPEYPTAYGPALAWCNRGTRLVAFQTQQNRPLLSGTTHWLTERKLVKTHEENLPKIHHLARSTSGNVWALACNDGTIRIRRSDEVVSYHALPTFKKEAWCVAFSPDGGTLAVTSDDHTARLYDVARRKIIATLKGHSSLVTCVRFSPDGREVYTGGWDGTIRTWDALTGKKLRTRDMHKGPIQNLGISPDGRWLASIGRDAKLILVDLTRDNSQEMLDLDQKRGHLLEFASDSTFLLVGLQNRIDRIDVNSGQRVATPHFFDDKSARGKLLDRDELLIGNEVGRLYLRNAAGETIWNIQAHACALRSLAVSPDGRTIASGGIDGSLRLWHRRTGRLLVELLDSGTQVNSLEFSPNGQYLASCNHSGQVSLWQTWRP